MSVPSAFMSWRLYSWRRLTWTSKSIAGSTGMPVSRRMRAAASALLARLHGGEPREESEVVLELAEAREVAEVGDPLRPELLGQERGEARVGLQDPDALRDAVRLVAEPLGPERAELGEEIALEQLASGASRRR